ALRIFDQCSRLIKAHGLIVEHGGGESREVMAFQKSAGVGDQGKTGGVRFWKAVQCKRSDGLHNFVLRFSSDSLGLHATTEFDFDFFHAGFGTLEAESPA